jgi:hypothetical protein
MARNALCSVKRMRKQVSVEMRKGEINSDSERKRKRKNESERVNEIKSRH